MMALLLHPRVLGASDATLTLPCTGMHFHMHLSSAGHPARLHRAEPSDPQNTLGNIVVWCQKLCRLSSAFSREYLGLNLFSSCNTATTQLKIILNPCLPSSFPTCVLFTSQCATPQLQVTPACFGFFKHAKLVPTPSSLHLLSLGPESLPLVLFLRDLSTL